MKQQAIVDELLAQHGKTYASEAGIKLGDQPAPLFQLLVLSQMLSARISSDKAVSATKALFDAGFTTTQKMAGTTWQQRVDAITWSGYKRFDEKGATALGDIAEQVLEKYQGDLRHMRQKAEDTEGLEKALKAFEGVGPLGAKIFLREVQSVWPELYPYADDVVLGEAEKLGLPGDADELSKLCKKQNFAALTAALIRVKLNKLEDEVKQAAG